MPLCFYESSKLNFFVEINDNKLPYVFLMSLAVYVNFTSLLNEITFKIKQQNMHLTAYKSEQIYFFISMYNVYLCILTFMSWLCVGQPEQILVGPAFSLFTFGHSQS